MSTETEKAAPAATSSPSYGKSCDCGEPSGLALFIGKAAIVFAVVAIVFYGLGYLFRGGGSVETPDFDDFGPDLITSTKQAKDAKGDTDAESQEAADTPEAKALRDKWQPKFVKEYGSLVTKIKGSPLDAEALEKKTKKYVFDSVLRGALQLSSAEMDEDALKDLRDDYVDGAYDCFRSFASFYSKDKFGSEFTDYWKPVFQDYDAQFAKSVKQAAKDEKDTADKDAVRAKIVTNAMFLLVFAAMVPLLAKIERNTRRG